MRLSDFFAVASLIVLSWMTFERNQIWRSPILVWSDATAKSPDKPRPWLNLAASEAQEGNTGLAHAGFRYVQTRFPKDRQAVMTATIAEAALSMHEGEWESARKVFERLIVDNQDHPTSEVMLAYNDLAFVYNRMGRSSDALLLLTHLITLSPDYRMNASVNFNRAEALRATGNCPEATQAFRMAHFIDPDVPVESCP